MDAKNDNSALVSAVLGLRREKRIPDVIYVGVSGLNYIESLQAKRFASSSLEVRRDNFLLAEAGCEKFYQFLERELLPYVEKNYSVNHDRAVVGSAMGGLFTLYALFHERPIFQRYIVSSPTIEHAKGLIFEYEQNYARNNDQLNASVFFSLAEGDSIADTKYFAKRLKNRFHKQFSIEMKTIDGLGRYSSRGESIARGLQYIYR